MTEKLYYKDSHLYYFSAHLLDIIETDDANLIVLDKTAFFPEGGGQASDTGYIDKYRIFDVREDNGLIFHYTKDRIQLTIGDPVDCKIDDSLRFAKMQAHSGEHILSGIAHNLYNVDNVGFHMDENLVMTVDFNASLSKEQIALIEKKSNECIYSNLPITTEFYSAFDALSFDFRSKIDFSDTVRIVSIESVDKCACCAPHVSFTGEIGLLKVLQCISHRGGVRLSVICGENAFNDYYNKFNQTVNISNLLCVPHSDTDKAVVSLIDQNKEIKRQLSEQKNRLIKHIASGVCNCKTIIEFYDDLSMEELRLLANELQEKCASAVFLFSGNDNIGYTYCIISKKLDLNRFVSELKSVFNTSGGGRGNIVQGKISANESDIRKYICEERVNNYENA